jgi:hypothetical protein
MPDPTIIAAAIAELKPTFDAVRSALSLLKEAKDLLPAGDHRQAAISQALATAESSSRIAEAEIAKAFGYELCKCEFPPTIMLAVGYHSTGTTRGPVHECPKCGYNTAASGILASLPGSTRRAAAYEAGPVMKSSAFPRGPSMN